MLNKIFILSWHPGYKSIQTAGGFKRLYEILMRNQDDNIVVFDKYPSPYKEISNSNLCIIEYGKVLSGFEKKLTKFLRLYKIIERFYTTITIVLLGLRFSVKKQDIIYVPFSELPQLTLSGVLLKWLVGCKLILCNLNVNVYFFDRLLNVYLHKFADSIITLTQSLKNDLNKTGINPTHLNPVGVNMQGDNQDLSIEKIYDAIFIGRHTREKGIYDLVEIWDLVTKKINMNAQLITIGDILPDDYSRLDRLLTSKCIRSTVKFLGNVSENSKLKYLNQSKVCIFPSHQEGWGIVPQEAIVSGLPVVVYNLDVYRENIYVCEAVKFIEEGDFEGFSIEVVNFLNMDVNELNTKLEQSKKVISKFSWEEIAVSEFKIIKDLRK